MVNGVCLLAHESYCRNDVKIGRSKLGCNWLQASIGCKKAGGTLVELEDETKENEMLAIIDEKVRP